MTTKCFGLFSKFFSLIAFPMQRVVLLHIDIFFYSPRTEDAWDFAHQDFTQAIGILSFGKYTILQPQSR